VLAELKDVPPEERINRRIEKFGRMGFWDEHEVPVQNPAEEQGTREVGEQQVQ
jgi:acetyl-CoA carboxylase carboxyl transferase subunit alpha